MNTSTSYGKRFMVSPDGVQAAWFYQHELAANLGWSDCTDMGAEELQRFVAGRQAKQSGVVGAAITAAGVA